MNNIATTPPPVPTRPAPAGVPRMPAATTKPVPSVAPAHKPKTFAISPWSDGNEGEKSIIYGKSGIGKTSLAAMAPNVVFIGIDDGGRKIRNPKTGQPVSAIPGIQGFQDLRDALHQKDLFPKDATIAIDTVTKLESVMEPYIFDHYKLAGGKTAAAMRQYGWDGPAHLLDCIRLLLTDLDDHVRQGRNVILLAQVAPATLANAGGADYLEDGPKLQHNKQYSVRTEVCEWADHVFRVGYQEFNVEKVDAKARAGKVTSDNETRAIFCGGAQHFIAKSRPVKGNRLPPVIAFNDPADDSLWQFMFGGATA